MAEDDAPLDHSDVAKATLTMLKSSLKASYRRSFSHLSNSTSSAASTSSSSKKRAKVDKLYDVVALEDLKNSFLAARADACQVKLIPLGKALNIGSERGGDEVPELR